MDEHLLRNVDPDDVNDVIIEIVGSLGIEFQPGELSGVITFGGFCKLVHGKLTGSKFGDCTTQQAFYKLKREIGQLLAGMGLSILGFGLAGYFGREWRVATLGEVARDMARFHYRKSRRNPQAYNPKEIDALIRLCFCDTLLLPPEALHSDALF